MSMMNDFKVSMKEAWKRVKANKKYFFLAIAFDLIFWLFYIFVTGNYIFKIEDNLKAIGIVALTAQGLQGSAAPSFLQLLFNSQTSPYLWTILLLLALNLVSIYILLSLFGISTYITFNLNSFSMKGLVKYIKKFLVVTIPWLIIFSVFEVISFHFHIMDTLRPKFDLPPTFFPIFKIIFLLLFIYFITISLLIDKKKNFRNSFKIGLRKFTKIFPVYFILILVLYLIIHKYVTLFLLNLSSFIFGLPLLLPLLFAVAVLLPFLSLARVIIKAHMIKMKIIKEK